MSVTFFMGKKIIILSASMDNPDFYKEEKTILETWGKDIVDGIYPNISIIFIHTTKEQQTYYNKEKYTLYVPCGDKLLDTYNKTALALRYVDENLDYDYVLKTNTATYINVNLLNKTVSNFQCDDKCFYGPRYIITASSRNRICFRGSFLLMPKFVVGIILKSYKNKQNTDDGEIGYCFAKYHEDINSDYIEKLKCLEQGYYVGAFNERIYNHSYAKNKISFRLRPLNSHFSKRYEIIRKMKILHRCIMNDKLEFEIPSTNKDKTVEIFYSKATNQWKQSLTKKELMLYDEIRNKIRRIGIKKFSLDDYKNVINTINSKKNNATPKKEETTSVFRQNVKNRKLLIANAINLFYDY